jgi:2'-5' RNA ligase
MRDDIPTVSSLLALDVAILPPPDMSQLAVELSAGIRRGSDDDLRLGRDQLPHITLTQQFVKTGELSAVLESLDAVLTKTTPLRLRISGGGRMKRTLWVALEESHALVELHGTLMATLRPFEQPAGSAAAFVDGYARPGDVRWVSGYRAKSSFDAYTPHITLGHGDDGPPPISPREFTATTVAACHLGRFCTCQRVLRAWELRPEA